MSQTLPPEIKSELDHLKEEIESLKTSLVKGSTSPLPAWLSTIFQGVTLTIVIGAAFWFGSLGNTVSRSEATLEELQKSVEELKESKVEINGNLRAIESRLTSIEKKLEEVTITIPKRQIWVAGRLNDKVPPKDLLERQW